MSRKAIISIIVSVVVLATIAGGWAYYYYYVETVNDYVLIKVTPPEQEDSLFGGDPYSKPEFEIEFEALPNYKSDDEAVADQTHKAQETIDRLFSNFDKEVNEIFEETNPTIRDARLKALNSLLSESRILIRATHIRELSAEEAFQMVAEHWADKSFEEYAKSKKIDVAVYYIE